VSKSAPRRRSDTSERHGRSNPQKPSAAKPRENQAREKRTAATHTPPKHSPVTVCHVLGNGGYHLLTFDDSALKAHIGHGDLYPVPASGCPKPEARVPSSQEETEQEVTRSSPSAAVLGAQAERSANRAAARVGTQQASPGASSAAVAPAGGVLPQTGAGEVALTLAAGIGLLAAGAGLLRRRRSLGSR
jgi:LPXTG-motif cell wall-anchored protein